MKNFDINQNSIVGVVLFATTVVLLLSTIVAGRLGAAELAKVLFQIAGPVCAATAAVLASRFLTPVNTDPEA
jgi:hypothetical protein